MPPALLLIWLAGGSFFRFFGFTSKLASSLLALVGKADFIDADNMHPQTGHNPST